MHWCWNHILPLFCQVVLLIVCKSISADTVSEDNPDIDWLSSFGFGQLESLVSLCVSPSWTPAWLLHNTFGHSLWKSLNVLKWYNISSWAYFGNELHCSKHACGQTFVIQGVQAFVTLLTQKDFELLQTLVRAAVESAIALPIERNLILSNAKRWHAVQAERGGTRELARTHYRMTANFCFAAFWVNKLVGVVVVQL